jgi:hypothetical protein
MGKFEVNGSMSDTMQLQGTDMILMTIEYHPFVAQT